MDDMFAQTSTEHAPWRVVSGEHKWFARVGAIETAVAVLGKGLNLEPPSVAKAVEKTARKLLKKKEFATLGF
jgi:AMP-polyphosphate phosphotransferase